MTYAQQTSGSTLQILLDLILTSSAPMPQIPRSGIQFDALQLAPGMCLENGGSTVISHSSTPLYTPADVLFAFGAKCQRWSFRLEQVNESVCVGIQEELTTKQRAMSYRDSNSTARVIRTRDATLFGKGNPGATRPCFKGHYTDPTEEQLVVGDTIECTLDMAAGTLQMSLNGSPAVVCFRGLTNAVQPIVYTESHASRVTILSSNCADDWIFHLKTAYDAMCAITSSTPLPAQMQIECWLQFMNPSVSSCGGGAPQPIPDHLLEALSQIVESQHPYGKLITGLITGCTSCKYLN